MKCPHCSTSIGLFSDEMKALGKSRTCPRCGGGVVMGLIPGRYAIGFAVVAIPALVFGLSSPFVAGAAAGVGAVFGFGLKRARA
jgi:hypothetical protein